MKKAIFITFIIALFAAIVCFAAACEGAPLSPGEQNGSALDFSAVYAMAEEAGYTGTLEELIAAFKGDNAYQLAVAGGYSGTVDEWLASLRGAAGKDGVTPTIGANKHWFIGEVDTGVVAEGKDGKDGAQGEPGRGIKSVEKSASAGNVDVYTITFTDNTTNTFLITNGTDGAAGGKGDAGAAGRGISKIEKTNTEELVDTYTITFTDGTTTSFQITNGKDGKNGVNADGSIAHDPDDPTDDEYFRFELLENDTYRVSARYADMPARTIIPASYQGKSVTAIAQEGFADRISIDEVVIPDSVTEIGAEAFAGCRWLSVCRIPVDAEIGEDAFEGTKIYFTLTTTTNLPGAGEYTQKESVSVHPGESVTLTASPNSGYMFDGWYDGKTLYNNASHTRSFKMPMANITYTARFSALYTLTTNTNIENAGSYTMRNNVKMKEGMRDSLSASPSFGYFWLGWYDGETLLTEDQTYSFDMPAKNVVYTAKFIACEHNDLIGCLCADCGAIMHDYVAGTCTRCGDKLIRRVDANGAPDEAGEYLLFGTYLQSAVSDSKIKKALLAQAGPVPSGGEPYAWSYDESRSYYYVDLSYENLNYRGVYNDNNSSMVWFKYEPIKWRIMSEEEGTAFIVAEDILDARRFDDSSNNYAESEIRAYLNDVFYNRAFAAAQQALIQVTAVDNSAASTASSPNPYACENTNDKIFLLSYSEARNAEFGFTNNASRQKKTTEYAKVQGAYTNDYSNGNWWFRSPGNSISYSAWGVLFDGSILDGGFVNYADFGVVPALKISLS